MPEDENIIPEAEIVPVENQEPTISFSPVSNTEEDEFIVPEVDTQVETTVDKVEEETADVPTTELEYEEEEYEALELDEDLAWEFLKKAKGIEADNIDSLLTPKEQKKYAPAMEKFDEFIKKTGNENYNDFLETQKDWNTETPETRLKSFLKLSNPEFSEKEVNRLYDKKYSVEDLDEEDDEDEILDKKINVKTDLKEADAFFEKRKQEFSAERGSDEHIPVEYREAKTQLDELTKQEEDFQAKRDLFRSDFVSKTDSLFNSDFEGFKIQLGDEKSGFEELSIKPDNLNEIKEYQKDSNNLLNEFVDPETGNFKDLKGYHEAMYMAKNYKTEMNKAYQRGMAKQLEISDKVSKNIQPDNIRQAPNNQSSGITFTLEK